MSVLILLIYSAGPALESELFLLFHFLQFSWGGKKIVITYQDGQ